MRIVAATGNSGKLAEFRAMLAPKGWEVIAQTESGRETLVEVEESGLTFVENALLKARQACAHSGLAALADDSGLEVDALGGAPGIYSARYAGAGASAAANMQKLLDNLAALPESASRAARFRCALVYMRSPTDPAPLISMAAWEGRVIATPRGAGGFGYDPIFYLQSLAKTSAQLPPALKNRLSHRGQALRQLVAWL